ncbi:MAG TPA: hypothetical protein VGC62_14100 [Pseudomonas sp.]|uniref:hypothetical protein n=1 Tax=Pseudomonas sp. TaxID=306 RepID=UPI002ED91FF3
MNISNTANTWLSQFKVEITSSANMVFGNGRQQLEATVIVAPRNHGTITDKQLASIALVTLDDDGVYRELTGGLKASLNRDPLYQYFADTGSAPSNLEIRGPVRRKRFYISSSRTGGSLDRVYARISKDESTYHVTDGGAFNSSIIIESITPRRYDENDFELSAVNELSTDRVDMDLYYLKFKNPQYQIVKSTPYTEYYSEPYDSFYNDDWYYRYCYETRSDAGQNVIASWYTHYAFEVGPKRAFTAGTNSITLNRRAGQMNLVRATTHEVSYNRPQNESERSVWGVIDQYGNERKIEFIQTDEGNRIGFKRFD